MERPIIESRTVRRTVKSTRAISQPLQPAFKQFVWVIHPTLLEHFQWEKGWEEVVAHFNLAIWNPMIFPHRLDPLWFSISQWMAPPSIQLEKLHSRNHTCYAHIPHLPNHYDFRAFHVSFSVLLHLRQTTVLSDLGYYSYTNLLITLYQLTHTYDQSFTDFLQNTPNYVTMIPIIASHFS